MAIIILMIIKIIKSIFILFSDRFVLNLVDFGLVNLAGFGVWVGWGDITSGNGFIFLNLSF